jgi:hypothetical protein
VQCFFLRELFGGKWDFCSVFFFWRSGKLVVLILELKKAQIQKALLPSKKSKMKKHGIYIVSKNNSFCFIQFFSNKFRDCRNDYRAIKAIINSIKGSQTKNRKKEDAAKFHKICFLERK